MGRQVCLIMPLAGYKNHHAIKRKSLVSRCLAAI